MSKPKRQEIFHLLEALFLPPPPHKLAISGRLWYGFVGICPPGGEFMSQTQKTTKPRRPHKRLKVWQRLFLVVAIVILLSLFSTAFIDFSRITVPVETLSAETTPPPADDPDSPWSEKITAYVIAPEGSVTVPFYNEALAVSFQCGRGAEVWVESWEPFVSETGTEYYHVYYNDQYGYILCENISDDMSDILQETVVYVRTTGNLLEKPNDITLGAMVNKGDMLRIVGYDYLREDGQVNMYEVKLGEQMGWIHSDYVVPTYAESLENWTNDDDIYALHVYRGDLYGGGDAGNLDYWPHEKGDFSAQGNVMPDSVYALYLTTYDCNPETVQQYLDLAEGSAVNTFVLTIFDDGEMAYPSPLMEEYGLMNRYACENTYEEFSQAIDMIRDAGYYIVARITAFKDSVLAQAKPDWSITDWNNSPMLINSGYWPSVFCRDVWELKVGLAVEVVDTFGINEIQFDYVRFPDYIISYEEEGTVDMKNEYGEEKAQAVQRFLIYAKDILHAHGAYVSADVFGETSNSYVAPYGQYWVAISTVVDVISGMPYPDHYNSYWTDSGYYSPYKHPYKTLYNWALHVSMRQEECSSPAIVRTWIQTWDDADYAYGEKSIEKQIAALYDQGITGGYMPWYGPGNLSIAQKLEGVIEHDFYALYLDALEEGQTLSEYMGIDTSE